MQKSSEIEDEVRSSKGEKRGDTTTGKADFEARDESPSRNEPPVLLLKGTATPGRAHGTDALTDVLERRKSSETASLLEESPNERSPNEPALRSASATTPGSVDSFSTTLAPKPDENVAGQVIDESADSDLAHPPRTPAEIRAEQERLMVEHLPIVRFLARRIHERLPQHVDLEDLVSAGVMGLIDAFSKFDPVKKVQFRSYAQFRIRGAMLDSLRTLDWSPRDLRRKGRAVEEAIRSLTARFRRAPLETEVALEMHMPLADYQQLLGDLKGLEIGTLHMERSEDSGEEELSYIPTRAEDDPLFRCLRGEMQQRLTDAIDNLPERERLVMTLYYYEEMTMKEIGLTLGVVESRVSQIHASSVLHLRSLLTDLSSQGGDSKSRKPPLRTAGGKPNRARRRGDTQGPGSAP